MDNKKYLLALNMVEGLGSLRISQLLKYFKTASNIFAASEKELQNVPQVGKEIAQRIKNFNWDIVSREIDSCRKNGIKIISIVDSDYPQILKHIPDPPVVLYIRGELVQTDFSLAIVGSRRASFYGLAMAEKFAYQLAAGGMVIISGMARGIDTASHRGALKAKGRTIAVLGSGLLNIYPPENKTLASEISNSGALISEFFLNMPPERENFPRRNRIISGLARAVLVVEAAKRSGALITADLALEQGRDVFAIPGKVDSPTSYGTNYLIKQGAKLISSVDDILEEFGLELNKVVDKNIKLGENEQKVFQVLNRDKMNLDQILLHTGLSIQTLNQALLHLEVKGIIKSLPGGIYSVR